MRKKIITIYECLNQTGLYFDWKIYTTNKIALPNLLKNIARLIKKQNGLK